MHDGLTADKSVFTFATTADADTRVGVQREQMQKFQQLR